jgi:hypothetical protein
MTGLGLVLRLADDSWKGPGWYQVFDDGHGIVMIWSGTYRARIRAHLKRVRRNLAFAKAQIALARAFEDGDGLRVGAAVARRDHAGAVGERLSVPVGDDAARAFDHRNQRRHIPWR